MTQQPPEVQQLTDAMASLHLAANTPTLRTIANGSGVSHTSVQTVLRTPEAATLRLLIPVVQYLGGEPEHFRQLWVEAKRALGEIRAARALGPAELHRQGHELLVQIVTADTWELLRVMLPAGIAPDGRLFERHAHLAEINRLRAEIQRRAGALGAVAGLAVHPGGITGYLDDIAKIQVALAALAGEAADRRARAVSLISRMITKPVA